MFMMLVAVYLSKRARPKQALLGRMITDSNMQTATVGCLVAGILMNFAGYIIPGGNGSWSAAAARCNSSLTSASSCASIFCACP